MTKVRRAVEKGETQGFMKVVVDAESKQILGAAILGTGGDEVVHVILDVMYARAPYTLIQRAMHIHPTVSELLPTRFRRAPAGLSAAALSAAGSRPRTRGRSRSRPRGARSAGPCRRSRGQPAAELRSAERSGDRADGSEDQAARERPGRRPDRGAAEGAHHDPGDELRRRLAARRLRQLVVDQLADRRDREDPGCDRVRPGTRAAFPGASASPAARPSRRQPAAVIARNPAATPMRNAST